MKFGISVSTQYEVTCVLPLHYNVTMFSWVFLYTSCYLGFKKHESYPTMMQNVIRSSLQGERVTSIGGSAYCNAFLLPTSTVQTDPATNCWGTNSTILFSNAYCEHYRNILKQEVLIDFYRSFSTCWKETRIVQTVTATIYCCRNNIVLYSKIL